MIRDRLCISRPHPPQLHNLADHNFHHCDRRLNRPLPGRHFSFVLALVTWPRGPSYRMERESVNFILTANGSLMQSSTYNLHFRADIRK